MKRQIADQGDGVSYWLPRWKKDEEAELGFSPENPNYDETGQMTFYLLKFITGNTPGSHPEAVIVALIEYLTHKNKKLKSKRIINAITSLETALWELEEGERKKTSYIARPKGKVETITKEEDEG